MKSVRARFQAAPIPVEWQIAARPELIDHRNDFAINRYLGSSAIIEPITEPANARPVKGTVGSCAHFIRKSESASIMPCAGELHLAMRDAQRRFRIQVNVVGLAFAVVGERARQDLRRRREAPRQRFAGTRNLMAKMSGRATETVNIA